MIQSTQPIKDLLKIWEVERLITPLDRHFALELALVHQEQLTALDKSHGSDNSCTQSLYKEDSYSELFLLICALLSKQLSQQHTCLPIKQIVLDNPMVEQVSNCQITCSHDELTSLLAQFPCIGLVSAESQVEQVAAAATPIVLDCGDLYLQRYYQFETQVSDTLIQLSKEPGSQFSPATKASLDILFPAPDDVTVFDWQKSLPPRHLAKSWRLSPAALEQVKPQPSLNCYFC